MSINNKIRFFIGGCTTAICSFTIDNVVDSATYDGNTLTITGDYLSHWKKEKSVTFESCHDLSPGTLVIKGSNDEGEGTYLNVYFFQFEVHSK